MKQLVLPLVAGLLLAGTALPASAQDTLPPPPSRDQNVFVMGGPFSTDYFGETFAFWDNDYETNVFLGAGYQQILYRSPDGWFLGPEFGAGLRLGQTSSLELWGGAVMGFDGILLGDIAITPSLTTGFSFVTNTIGIESERAAQIDNSAHFLYYLGPELAFSHVDNPEIEIFGRIQHRSGGFGSIADIDGSNATVIGLRYNF